MCTSLLVLWYVAESMHAVLSESVLINCTLNSFTSILNQERSNMLRAIKEASTLVFAPLKISDATIFTSPACKRDDPEMKRLSMKDSSYHRLSPIMFANPNHISPKGFLRSPVHVNVSCKYLTPATI
jgi:hypothetical protein